MLRLVATNDDSGTVLRFMGFVVCNSVPVIFSG